jgi:hypothetical protein
MQMQELVVPLKLDDSNFTGGIENSITKATAFGNIIGNLATSAISGAFNLLGKGIQTVTGFLSDSVGEAMASQEAISQLEAVIKSTGGVAGVTSKQAQDLASSFQKVTKFSDEAVLGGENMLLTFTSIGKEVFPRATETILDMSTALNQDLKSSAIQLGKALNDPIQGVTALRRVGVQFSDEQETMIKKMVESGDLMKAQTYILDELQKEFGGSAKAAGATFGGQLEILKNKLSDVKENIGNALLPVLGTLADKFSKLIDSPQFKKVVDTVIKKLGELGTWIETNLPSWLQTFEDVFTGKTSISSVIEEGATTAGTKFGEFIDKFFGIENMDKAKEGGKSIGRTIVDAVSNFFASATGVDKFGGLQNWIAALDNYLIKEAKRLGNDFVTTLQKALQGAIGISATNPGRNVMGGNTTTSGGGGGGNKGRASGGPVIAGQSYNVAEFYKPEVFTPNTSGRIDNKQETRVSVDIDYNRLAKVFAVELAKVTN